MSANTNVWANKWEHKKNLFDSFVRKTNPSLFREKALLATPFTSSFSAPHLIS